MISKAALKKWILVGWSRCDIHTEDILLCANHAFAKQICTILVVLIYEPIGIGTLEFNWPCCLKHVNS